MGEGFEVDGIYTTRGSTSVKMYGRRLSANELSCHRHYFKSKVTDDWRDFALAATSDADCKRCGAHTAVRAGSHSGGECVADNAIVKMIKNNKVCSMAAFVIKFSDPGMSGIQNLIECSANDVNSNNPGSVPKYPSAEIACYVRRAGTPEFYQPSSTGANTPSSMCFTLIDSDGYQFLPPALNPAMVYNSAGTGNLKPPKNNIVEPFIYPSDNNKASLAIRAGGHTAACYNLDKDPAKNFLSLDDVIEDQDASELMSLKAHVVDSDIISPTPYNLLGRLHHRYLENAIYTTAERATYRTIGYGTTLPCSNAGTCDDKTGICACKAGYTGDACETAPTSM